MIRALFAVGLLCLFYGCATTDDPHEGGLISYMVHGEDAYQKRLEEKQITLSAEQENQRQAVEATSQLEREKQAKLAELSRQRKQMATLDNDLVKMSESIKNARTQTAAKNKEKENLLKKADALRKEIDSIENNTNLSIEERKKRIEALDKEATALLEIASSL